MNAITASIITTIIIIIVYDTVGLPLPSPPLPVPCAIKYTTHNV